MNTATVTVKAFKTALIAGSKQAKRNKYLPICGHILIDAAGPEVRVFSHDGQKQVDKACEAHTQKPFFAAVPPQVILGWIRTCQPASELTLEFYPEKQVLVLKNENATAHIKCHPEAEDYLPWFLRTV